MLALDLHWVPFRHLCDLRLYLWVLYLGKIWIRFCVRSFLFLFPFLRLLLLERHEAKDDDNVYVVDPRRVFRSDRKLVDVWLGQVWVPDYAPLCI